MVDSATNELKAEDVVVNECFVRVHRPAENDSTLYRCALFVLYWTHAKTQHQHLDTLALTGPIRVTEDGTVVASAQQWFYGAVDDWNGFYSKLMANEGIVDTGDSYTDKPARRLIDWNKWFSEGGER